MSNGLQREYEQAFEDLFKEVFKGISKIIRSFFRGIGKLKIRNYLFGFLAVSLFTELVYVFRFKFPMLGLPVVITKLIYLILMLSPCWYLICIGGSQDKRRGKYDLIFKEIGFGKKDGNIPGFCESFDQGKKTILLFKTVIPLVEWKNKKKLLETGLDCHILSISNTKSKRVVRLVTVSAEYEIPEYLPWDNSYVSKTEGVIVIGVSLLEQISFDLNKTPHVLIAGETGSGKSVILRCCLYQMIYQGARIFMFDFKGGIEFNSTYETFGKVITDRQKAIEILDRLKLENDLRMEELKKYNAKNIIEYNKVAPVKMCRIGVFCDEAAEMMDKQGANKLDKGMIETISGKIATLARLSRATGINVFLGVQRPDANVVTGQIKSNLPVRICGRFADRAPSEIVLDNTAATELSDIKGRFLFKAGYEIVEFQSFFFKDHVTESLKGIYKQKGILFTDGNYESATEKIVPIENAVEKQPRKSKARIKQKNSDDGMSLEESAMADEILMQMDHSFDDEELPF